MKRFSRLVAAMVALALVLTGVVFAETQGTIAERYQDALSRLERYLMNLQDDSVNITTLAEETWQLRGQQRLLLLHAGACGCVG